MIDKEGNVRIPHVESLENKDYAWAALTAIKRWRFKPPLFNGSPVNVRTQIPVQFKVN